MKFTCDQCHAQYMIADEKVGDKGVKVKCKKCAHIIIVRPAVAAEPAPGLEPVPEPEPALPPAADPAAPPGGFPAGFETSDTVVTRSPAFDAGGLPQRMGGIPGAAAASGASPDDDGGAVASEYPAVDTDSAGIGSAFGAGQPAPVDAGADAAAAIGDGAAADAAAGGGGDTASGAGADLGESFGGGAGVDLGGEASAGFAGDAAADAGAGPEMQPAPGAAAPDDQMGGAFDSLFGGGAAAEPVQPASADAGTAPEALAPTAVAGPKQWYVAIDDSQIGPIDIAEIEQRWDGREIDEDSLAWKTGMDDWSPVAEIPELAYLVTERPHETPGAAASLGAGFGAMAMAGGAVAADGGAGRGARPITALGPVAFGGGEAAPDVNWKPSAASALDLLVQEELVSSEPAAAPDTSSAVVPDGMPSFGGVGPSGGNGGTVPAPTFAPAAASFVSGGGGFAVPQPRPRAGSGGLKPIHLILTVIALAVLGIVGILAWKVLTPPTPAGAVAQRVIQPAPAAPGAQPAPAPGTAPAPARAEPRPAPHPTVKKSGGSNKGSGASKSGGGKKSAGKKGGKRGGGNSLDDVFDEPRKPSKPAKEKLSVQDIVAGVKKNAGSVMPCLKSARGKGEIVPGTYKLILDWKIKPDGSVTRARLKGPSKVMGTSLPPCFARKMRAWHFPSSRQGAPVANFPFGPFTVH